MSNPIVSKGGCHNIHLNRVSPLSDYGHATHLHEAENAISSHLISILSDCDFGGDGAIGFVC